MSLYYTERRPNHNLIYTVDHTFGYRSKKFIRGCTKSEADSTFENNCGTLKVMDVSPLSHKVPYEPRMVVEG